jgi:hypothetical protein
MLDFIQVLIKDLQSVLIGIAVDFITLVKEKIPFDLVVLHDRAAVTQISGIYFVDT